MDQQWLLSNGNRGVTVFEMFDKSRPIEDVEATNMRDRAKHTFGNLTLLTQPLNSSVSKSAFELKSQRSSKTLRWRLTAIFITNKVGMMQL